MFLSFLEAFIALLNTKCLNGICGFFAVAVPCKPPSRYAQNDKINLCHTYKSCHTDLPYRFVFPCHTERSEVSINLKCKFKPLKRGFSLISLT